jgi:hypothetical protein
MSTPCINPSKVGGPPERLDMAFVRFSPRYLTSLASFSPDLVKRRSAGESGACNEQNQD